MTQTAKCKATQRLIDILGTEWAALAQGFVEYHGITGIRDLNRVTDNMTNAYPAILDYLAEHGIKR